ncbi:uncharacterized protein CBL_02596 [Carabus blaptoides fortunei]
MSVINQKEYLKKYLSLGSEKDKSKKRKKRSKIIKDRLKIIDDDIDLPCNINENELNEFLTAEDAPQVCGMIDDRPLALRLDDYRKSDKWKLVGSDDELKEQENKQTENSSQKKTKYVDNDLPSSSNSSENRRKSRFDNRQSDSDASPPRKDRNHSESDVSPRRETKKNYDSDVSPPRKNKTYDSDVSPPRKNRKTLESDASPPRKNRKTLESDASLPRKDRKTLEFDASSSRKTRKSRFTDASPPRDPRKSDSDASPPRPARKSRFSDASPPQQSRFTDASPVRTSRKSESDESPPRRPNKAAERSRKDSSPVRKSAKEFDYKNNRGRYDQHKQDKYQENSRRNKTHSSPERSDDRSGKMSKTLDGKTAGLQSGADLKKETAVLRKKENDMFKNMSAEVSGKDAAPILRDRKTGKRRDLEQEAMAEYEKQQKENVQKEKYAKWGKGLKQVDEHKEKMEQDLYEMSKPLARYADDQDLERHLKEQEREGDPMLKYIRKKKRKEAEATGVSFKPQYDGEFMPNRFGIPPGHRWDGVDRSSGYEKQWFIVQNSKKAVEEEVYKWSTEDM